MRAVSAFGAPRQGNVVSEVGLGICGLEFGVWGLGFRVWGSGFRVWVQGLGFSVDVHSTQRHSCKTFTCSVDQVIVSQGTPDDCLYAIIVTL